MTSNGTEVATTTPMQTLSALLDRAKPKLSEAVAKHIDPNRLIKVGITAAHKNPKLMECTPESFLLALMEAGQLGLEPTGVLGQAYLIPYRNKGTQEVQLQVGYRGMVELVIRGGMVRDIEARIVRDGDLFEYAFGLNPRLDHVPAGELEPGDITHVYAIARFKDGSSKFDVMARPEVEKVRQASKAATSGPWVSWYGEMAKKSVVRRLCKSLPMSPELSALMAKDTSVEIGQAEALASFDSRFGAPPPIAVETRAPKSDRLAAQFGNGQEPEVAPEEDDGSEATDAQVEQLTELLAKAGDALGPDDVEAFQLAIHDKNGPVVRQGIRQVQADLLAVTA